MNQKQVNLKCANQRERLQVKCVQGKRTQTTETQNREYKSDVFSMLMEDAENALQVYNALNGSAYDDPTPHFIVFYNGVEELPAVSELKLSDAFFHKTDEPQLELKCTVYNINSGMNDSMLARCQVLREYMEFVEKVRELKSNDVEDFVEAAVDWCVENDVLKEFLLARKDEVIKNMTIDMTFERRAELIREDAYEEGKTDGKSEGLAEGLSKGYEMLISIVRDGYLDVDVAASKAGLTVEEFRKLMNQ